MSLTEALDLTTAACRTMAGLLAVFAEFEREILQGDRADIGPAHPGGANLHWQGMKLARGIDVEEHRCHRKPNRTSIH